MTRLTASLLLAGGILLSQAVLFMLASSTFGLGIFVVMHGWRGQPISPAATAVFVVGVCGVLLTQALAPIIPLFVLRSLRTTFVVRGQWVLYVAPVVGPVIGGAMIAATGGLWATFPTVTGFVLAHCLLIATAASVTFGAVSWSLQPPVVA